MKVLKLLRILSVIFLIMTTANIAQETKLVSSTIDPNDIERNLEEPLSGIRQRDYQ